MPSRKLPGVFCLETLWDDRDLTDDSSVRPSLELLQRLETIKFIHRDVGTRSEFETLLDRWLLRRYRDYGIGYLAFHGSPGSLWVGNSDLPLEDLAELMGRRAEGRILCFGSCATMRVPPKRARAFLRATGVRAICGYTRTVDWVTSAAFEILLVEALTHSDNRVDTGFRRLERLAPGIIEALGFRAVWATGTAGAT